MILRGSRAVVRLSNLTTQCLDKHVAQSLALNIIRVSASRQHCLGNNDGTFLNRPSISTLLPYRPYATNAVSRPKAHTGRTTSAPRKRAATAKAPSERSTKVPKKPAAKKSKTKTTSKTKSKPRTRAKSTKARKKPAKAKKPKKPKLTPEEKNRVEIKALKEKALTPPKNLPVSAWTVLLSERQKKDKTSVLQSKGSVAQTCAVQYKSFTPEEREHYNHIANENRATNASNYQEWLRSYTPAQINDANNARITLKRRTNNRRTWPKLEDERLVKRAKTPYNLFYRQRYRSGDFAGMNIPEAAKLIGSEWRSLNANERKTYSQSFEEESARYDQEVKAVYNRDVRRKAAKAA